MTDKPILYSYFRKTAEVLSAEYERSKEQSASLNLGKNREYFCKEFLSKALPPKLSIKSGEIWDSQKNKTGQLDIVILRDDAPSLHVDSDDVYLAEGVFGVVEVKSNLTREKFIESGETLVKVANLKNNVRAAISFGSMLDRPLRVVFAYEGATWETIIDEINKKNWIEIFDLICILNRGVLLKKGCILNWSTGQEFMVVNSKSASLGYLYLYLISYGASFLGRGMILNPYFEPFNNWIDN
jgi:hypothetical protein